MNFWPGEQVLESCSSCGKRLSWIKPLYIVSGIYTNTGQKTHILSLIYLGLILYLKLPYINHIALETYFHSVDMLDVLGNVEKHCRLVFCISLLNFQKFLFKMKDLYLSIR